jgi:hypothetical protein
MVCINPQENMELPWWFVVIQENIELPWWFVITLKKM